NPDAVPLTVDRLGAGNVHQRSFRARSAERVQVGGQVDEVRQRASRQEIVDERQRRLKSASERRVVGRPDQRVEPDQAMTTSLEPRNLLCQLRRTAATPT